MKNLFSVWIDHERDRRKLEVLVRGAPEVLHQESRDQEAQLEDYKQETIMVFKWVVELEVHETLVYQGQASLKRAKSLNKTMGILT